MRARRYLYGLLGLLSLLGFIGIFTEERSFLGFFAFAVDFSYFFVKSDEMWERNMNRSASLAFCCGMIITAMAAVSCLYFLSLNTTMTDILAVLRKLHCPPLLSELMLLIYRYIFLLLDIAYFISLSQDSRLGHKDFPTSLRSFAALAQTLFIRATEKSRVLYDAMEARCYDGEIHVLEENRPASKKHIAAIIFFESFLLAVTLYIRLF